MARFVAARIALLLGLLLCAASPAAAEEILEFEVQLQLEAEGDAFVVLERILYDFGDEQRRGIYRDIPVAYGRGRAADYRIGLDVLSVADGLGQARPFVERRRGRNLRIRIGDPDRTLSGRQEYWIRYRVHRGLLYFADHDELYWNVTGTGWQVPIRSASARVQLPEAGLADRVQLACFTGSFGSVEQACSHRYELGEASYRAERGLGPKEGLSLVLGLPKGVLVEPSPVQRWLSRASDFLGPLSILPPLVLFGMTWLWWTRGRDRGARASIPVRYEPPEGLTPAEVGTLLDESADMADLTSTILDLAVRGYLRIEELDTPKFIFFSDTDWRLVRLKPPEGLRRHERLLMERLFVLGERVLVSRLRAQFYRHLPEIEEALYTQLSRDDKLFSAAPHRVRRRWKRAGIGLMIGAVLATGWLVSLRHTVPLGLCGVVLVAFARAMPRRTRKGRTAYEELLGFQEFVQRVDRDRLERSGGRDAERFERVLPYALVLGAADGWADAFADIYVRPPDWYQGRHGDFLPRRFVTDLGRSLDGMGRAMASRPAPESGGSGGSRGSGSSGFGGGGFSGGGFGGGGGGSW